MVLPDAAMPTISQMLPAFSSHIEAKSLDDAGIVGVTGSLLRGSWKRALQSTLGSQREFGFTCKILGHQKEVINEHCFRVATKEDREQLLHILQHPVEAAHAAQVSSTAIVRRPPPTPPPPAPEQPQQVPLFRGPTSGVSANNSSSASSSSTAAAPTQVEQPSKTAHYGLSPVAPPPSTTTCPSSSSSAATPVSASPVEPALHPVSAATESSTGNEDSKEDGQCVVCMDRPADSAVIPCGHMCACDSCLRAVQASAMPQCPMCRGPVTSVIRIYR